MVIIIKRVLHLLLVLWFTLSLIFLALVAMKGNPISLFMDPRLGTERLAELEALYGYSDSPLQQYLNYLRNVVRGELGFSFLFKRPVADVIPQRLLASVGLGLSAYFLAGGLSILLLLGLDKRRPQVLQKCSTALHMFLLSVPSFVLATLLMGLLGVRWHLFPITGSRGLFAQDLGFWANFVDIAHHAVLPVLSLALPFTGQLTAYLQEQLVALEQSPFVISARGRGLSEQRIFWNHKLRVLLPSVFQLGGLYLPTVAVGTLIIESIFGWSGMGELLFDAVTARDFPLLLGGSLGTVLFVVTGYEVANHLRSSLSPQGKEV